jgi:hypothetical protein
MVLLLVAAVAAIWLLPASALMFLLRNPHANSISLASARGSYRVWLQSNSILNYFNNIVLKYLLPLICAYYLLALHQAKAARKWAMFSFALLGFVSVLSLEKSPIISIPYFVLTTGLVGGYRLNLMKNLSGLIRVGLLMLATGVAMYLVIGGVSAMDAMRLMVYRVFAVQYVGWPVAKEVFPGVTGFLGLGELTGSLARLFGTVPTSFSRVTMAYVNPYGFESGTGGYLATVFLAEAWAIGGAMSLVIGTACSFGVLLIWDWFGARTQGVLSRSLYALAVFKLPFAMLDSLNGVVANAGLFAVVAIVVALMIVNTATLHGGRPYNENSRMQDKPGPASDSMESTATPTSQ